MSLEKGIKLESVGCVLDSKTGIVYPMLADGTTDLEDDGVHLEDVTEEWGEALSVDEMTLVLEVYNTLTSTVDSVESKPYVPEGTGWDVDVDEDGPFITISDDVPDEVWEPEYSSDR
mgnify:CR=1 FL=1